MWGGSSGFPGLPPESMRRRGMSERRLADKRHRSQVKQCRGRVSDEW